MSTSNRVAFDANNKSGTVVYEIWRRKGDEGEWGHHRNDQEQAFEDTLISRG